jgi:hypothetical protein
MLTPIDRRHLSQIRTRLSTREKTHLYIHIWRSLQVHLHRYQALHTSHHAVYGNLHSSGVVPQSSFFENQGWALTQPRQSLIAMVSFGTPQRAGPSLNSVCHSSHDASRPKIEGVAAELV